ncbi:MAG: hypothetical protein IJ574_05330 [Bacilli bacterium]|nr:hypothetical protein [Bacilli bacterium]
MKDNKVKKFIPLVIVVILIITILGYTFSLWTDTKKQQLSNTNVSSCLDVSIDDVTSSIALTNAFPVIDSEGLKQEGYTFTITNNCNSLVRYDVNLESTYIDGVSKTNYIDINNINLAVNDDYVYNLGLLDERDITLYNESYDSRNMKSAVLRPNGVVEYILKLWLDEDTPMTEKGKSWNGKVTVTATIENNVEQGSGSEYLLSQVAPYTSSLMYDGTSDNNLRYVGADPNNYVNFNNELWRIIGVMNNIENGSGKSETRIKLIRDESLGEFPYYDSCADEDWTNNGNGTYTCNNKRYNNNWENSTANEILNTYYNNGAHSAYHGIVCINSNWIDYPTSSIDFTSSGLSTSKSLIENTIYYLGGYYSNGEQYDFTKMITSTWYEAERSNSVYIGNPATWTSDLGLMYPSDYGYASSGTVLGSSCKTIALNTWGESVNVNCRNNDWLFSSTWYQWTITPRAGHSSSGAYVDTNGGVYSKSTDFAFNVRPVLYLKSSVKILNDGNDGSREHPYNLSL